MKKELIAVIIAGFILGLLTMIGFKLANQAVEKKNEQINPASSIPSKNVPPEAPSSEFLTIIKPEDEALIESDKVILSANTLPDLPIAVAWEKGETITISDQSGNIDLEIPLIPGINEITLSVQLPDGNEINKNLKLFYSTEKIE